MDSLQCHGLDKMQQCQWQSSRSGRDGVQQMQFMFFLPAVFLPPGFFSPHVGLLCQPALSTGLCFFSSSHGQVTWEKARLIFILTPPNIPFLVLPLSLLYSCLISLSPSLHLLYWEVDLFSLVLFLSLLCTVVDRCPFVDIFAWYLVILCCFDRTYDVTIHDHCLLLLQSWLLIKNLSPLP